MPIDLNEKLYCIVLLDNGRLYSFDEAESVLCSVKLHNNTFYIDDIIDNSKVADKMKRGEITFSKDTRYNGSRFYTKLFVIEPFVPLKTVKRFIESEKRYVGRESNSNYFDIYFTMTGYGLRFFSASDDDSARLMYQLNLF